ncbi:hypothetical protein GBA52_014793 [Prunus armeniaca]|nr:hypothetical protein GBA52_014793 [Prunus armeniaca]
MKRSRFIANEPLKNTLGHLFLLAAACRTAALRPPCHTLPRFTTPLHASRR